MQRFPAFVLVGPRLQRQNLGGWWRYRDDKETRAGENGSIERRWNTNRRRNGSGKKTCTFYCRLTQSGISLTCSRTQPNANWLSCWVKCLSHGCFSVLCPLQVREEMLAERAKKLEQHHEKLGAIIAQLQIEKAKQVSLPTLPCSRPRVGSDLYQTTISWIFTYQKKREKKERKMNEITESTVL